MTRVPFCTGVPDDSMTTAVSWTAALVGTTVTDATSRIELLVGASSGTLSQPAAATTAARAVATARRWDDDMRRVANDNRGMELDGQGAVRCRPRRDGGFAMAALLVGMSIMAVLMSAALPVWNKQAQREREEEYLFRANQYARAVMKFRQRIANTNPPTVDLLIEQKFLRKKYKDPINGEDFQLVYQTAQAGLGSGANGSQTPGQIAPPGGGTPGGGTAPGGGSSGFGGGTSGFGGGTSGFGGGTSTLGTRGSPTTTTGGTATTTTGGTATTTTGGTTTQGSGAAGPNAGIIGVVSKSKKTSMKIYNGRTRYDQWAVTYQDVKVGKGLPPDLLQAANAAGAAASGNAAPGGNPFGGGARPGAANPFGGAAPGSGAPGPFGGAAPGTGAPNPFGGAPNPSGGGFGQPAPPAPGSGSPFRPAYPAPPPPGGGSLFGPPPKKG